MNSIVKKILGLSLTAALLGTGFAGCKDDTSEGTSADKAMGRYLEEEAATPEGIVGVMDMRKLEDGRIRLLGMEESGFFQIWDSRDEGTTWEKAVELTKDTFGDENEVWLSAGAIAPSGEGFLIGYDLDASSATHYYHVTEQGNIQEVSLDLGKIELEEGESFVYQTSEKAASNEIDLSDGDALSDSSVSEENFSDEGNTFSMPIQDMSNNLMKVKYSDDGKVFGSDSNGKILRINPQTGEIEQDFGSEVQSFGIAGKTLIATDYSGNTSLYDTVTGEPIQQDEVLAEALKGKLSEMNFVTFGSDQVLFHTGDEENSLYYCDSTGLYRHIWGGSVQELLIDGVMNSLGNPDSERKAMVSLENNAFLIATVQSDEVVKLLKYTYSKDIPSRPSKELKIYSLYDNAEVRQAISMFQKENSDYYVSLETGITGEDGVTVSDALKTLNTDIMAGKGPDILIMDGMSIQSYREKGLLSELSDVLDALEKGDGCFENIANTYADDGKVFAIPSRFTIPVIQADADTMNAVSDLKCFADRVEQLRKEDAQVAGIVKSDAPETLAEKLYQSYSPAIQKEDGTLNEEKVREFYTQLLRIYKTGSYDYEDQTAVSYSVIGMGGTVGSKFSGISEEVMELLGGKALKVNVGSMGSIMDYCQVLSVNGKMEKLDFGLMQLAGKKVYCPSAILGINSKSSKAEDAKKFVSYVLGEEVQSLNQGSGFPINKTAFDASTVDQSNGEIIMSLVNSDMFTGEMVELNIYWPEVSAFDRLKEQIESLDTSMLTDDIIWSAVKEQAVKCLEGESSVDDAVNTLIQKVNLYLAE